jgi:DNA-binding beta-propeller fold protein YncE
MTGSIHEIVAPGEVRQLNPKGLLWPMGIAVAGDGSVYVADGSYAYVRPSGGELALAGMIFTPGYPGFHRGVAAAGPGEWLVTTSVGEVRRWNPEDQENELLASGYDRLMSIAAAPDRSLVFAEAGSGRVHMLAADETSVIAADLDFPTGVAVCEDGTVFASESGGGRVVKLCGGQVETVVDGLEQPEGLTVHRGMLYVVDVLSREIIEVDLATGTRSILASNLPVGAPTGPRPYLGPAGEFSGPMISFAGLTAGSDGTLYFGADGNGSVMAFHRSQT